MEQAIQLIRKVFENREFTYEFLEEDNIFVTKLPVGPPLGDVDLGVGVYESNYIVYAMLDYVVDEVAMPRVAEFLHRVNYGLHGGNFELDYNDRQVRYKFHVDFERCTLSYVAVENSIFYPLYILRKYGRFLLRAIYGNESVAQLSAEGDAYEW